ncbi:hypothetical protein JXB41_06800 [Candidatus Woesearchaeota archaeon]|nr:hypothetical protein [Candidatus Woesearchaeota archaeon]
MAFLDKVQFWKKKDDFNDSSMPQLSEPLTPIHEPALPKEEEFPSFESVHGFPENKTPMGAPLSSPADAMGAQNQSTGAYAPPNAAHYTEEDDPPAYGKNQPPGNLLQKELEIISTKLDYLKATLENISQRLANLERESSSADENKYRW